MNPTTTAIKSNITVAKTFWGKVKKYRALLLMILPGFVYIFINNYLPMFGIIIAFKNINYALGIWASEWVGFSNFEFLFSTEDAYIITRNTVLYNLVFIVLNTSLAVGVAILINEIRLKIVARLYQSVIIIPSLLSWVIVGYLSYSFLSIEYGFINKLILQPLGFDPISWFSHAKYWPYILVTVNTWKSVGFASVIYLAAIMGINSEYYEAATLDGASRLQQIRSITIPLITPVIVILFILAIGGIFRADFGLFYQVSIQDNAGVIE